MTKDFYYVTAASGDGFIRRFAQFALRSLLKAGVDENLISIGVNTVSDKKLIKSLVPSIKNIYVVDQDLSMVKWKKWGNTRKYSLFKAASLYKMFPEPISGKAMVYFDGDVLWYKNPNDFFATKSEKTWFHHGKSLEKTASIKKEDIDITDENSLGKWCSLPQAHLMVKYGAKVIPDREVVAGLYMLHPKDHAKVLEFTYNGCLENSDKFVNHEGVGDQKPMNAALAVLNIDWHGGSRFFCPEHTQYFDHFFGKQEQKSIFDKKVKELKL